MKDVKKFIAINVAGLFASILVIGTMYFALGYNRKFGDLVTSHNATIVLKSFRANDIRGLVEIASAKAVSRHTGVLLGYKLQDICSNADWKNLESQGWVSPRAEKSREMVMATFLNKAPERNLCENVSNSAVQEKTYWTTSQEVRSLLSNAGVPYDSISVATIGGLN